MLQQFLDDFIRHKYQPNMFNFLVHQSVRATRTELCCNGQPFQKQPRIGRLWDCQSADTLCWCVSSLRPDELPDACCRRNIQFSWNPQNDVETAKFNGLVDPEFLERYGFPLNGKWVEADDDFLLCSGILKPVRRNFLSCTRSRVLFLAGIYRSCIVLLRHDHR